MHEVLSFLVLRPAGLLLGAVVIVIVILVALVRAHARTVGAARSKDLRAEAWIAALSTFLGVFLAIFVGQLAEDARSHAALLRMIDVSRSEAASSLGLLEQAKDEDARTGTLRLVLEAPARSLSVVVTSPEFLQSADSQVAAAILHASTALSYQVQAVPAPSAGMTVSPNRPIVITPEPEDVKSCLHAALRLLDCVKTRLEKYHAEHHCELPSEDLCVHPLSAR